MIGVLGAGAFGTALACAFSSEETVRLWCRDVDQANAMRVDRVNANRLPGVVLPNQIVPTASLEDTCEAEVLLLAIPLQRYATFCRQHERLLRGKTVIACSKGIDVSTGRRPTQVLKDVTTTAGILSGPSFAKDIAVGLPTALTLAMPQDPEAIQHRLSTPLLRLYSTTDVTGVELGGALKNVMAIACGAAIGGGFGESARAAILTRAFQEMLAFATHFGARVETLTGLSGFGDLVLTCTSDASRNYRAGMAIGRGDAVPSGTTEGIATARIAAQQARDAGLDLPVMDTIAKVLDNQLSVGDAVGALLDRPLRKES